MSYSPRLTNIDNVIVGSLSVGDVLTTDEQKITLENVEGKLEIATNGGFSRFRTDGQNSYLINTGEHTWFTNDISQMVLTPGQLAPSTTAVFDLGTSALRYDNIYGTNIFATSNVTATEIFANDFVENGTYLNSKYLLKTSDTFTGTLSVTGAVAATGNVSGLEILANDFVENGAYLNTKYLLKTTDTLTGNLTVTGTVTAPTFAGNATTATSAAAVTGAQAAAIIANTAKVSNVTTNLTTTHNASTVVINSSDGTDATINAATATTAGIMSEAIYDEHLINNAKVSNVTTNLGTTHNASTVVITSSDGTDATINAATATTAGIMSEAIYDEHLINNAKVSNIVQTSVTGNAGTVTNGVYTIGDQDIAGTKTFTSNIVGNLTGNADTATTASALTGAQATAISNNTAKVSNVTTNLGTTHNASTVVITSSDGTDATINAATATTAGIMSEAIYDEHLINNAKVSNIVQTTITGNAGTADFATNAGTLDTLDSTQFLRSDANDNKTAGYTRYNDGLQIQLGSGADSRLYHNGSHSYNDNYTGNMYFRNIFNGGEVIIEASRTSGTRDVVFFASADTDTSAQLRFNNSTKLGTTNTGVTVTGTLAATGNVTGTEIFANDFIENGTYLNSKYLLRTTDTFTGDLTVTSNVTATEILANDFVENGAYLNTKYLLKTSDTLTGNLTVTGTVTASAFTGTASNAALLDNIDSSQFLRSDVSDSWAGTQTGNTLHLGGAEITGSSAVLQVNGFQRTGNIFLHQGGLTPTATPIAGVISNASGNIQWDGDNMWHAGNLVKGVVASGDIPTRGDADARYLLKTSDTLTGNLTVTGTVTASAFAGNATTATTLQTSRTIAGVPFNGGADISLNNNAITNGAGYITNSGGTTASTPNTIVRRNASGDINLRLVRSEYANQTNILGAMAFRVNDSADNYIRFCSNTSAIRTYLGLGTAATATVTTSSTDTTAGRLTKVDDFGIGAKSVPFGAAYNIDTHYTSGNYVGYSGTHPNASTGDNPFPTSGGAFALTCSGGGLNSTTNYVSQTATVLSSGSQSTKVRAKTTGAWSDWAEVWTNDNLVKTTSSTDTTAGSMLKVGDFGLGISSVNISNYNNLSSTQFFEAPNGTTNQPTPASHNYSGVRINGPNGNNGVEIACATTNTTGALYFRQESATVYGSWREILHTGNLNLNQVGGSGIVAGDYLCRGYAYSATGAAFFVAINNFSAPPSSLTVLASSAFEVTNAGGVSRGTVPSAATYPQISLNTQSGNRLLLITVTGLSGMTVGEVLNFRANATNSGFTYS